MKYCPQCETEYLDKASQCADCGCPLLSEEEFNQNQPALPQIRDPKVDMEMICEVYDQVDADQIADLLENENIPFHLHSYEESVYIGHSDLHQGFGEMWVPSGYARKARSLVVRFRGNPPVPNDEY